MISMWRYIYWITLWILFFWPYCKTFNIHRNVAPMPAATYPSHHLYGWEFKHPLSWYVYDSQGCPYIC